MRHQVERSDSTARANRVLDVRFDSADAMQAAAAQAGWDVEYAQLGPFSGRLQFVELGDVAVDAGTYDGHVYITGATPSDYVVLLLTLACDEPPTYRGRPLGMADVMIASSESEFDFVTKAGTHCAALKLPRAQLLAHARRLGLELKLSASEAVVAPLATRRLRGALLDVLCHAPVDRADALERQDQLLDASCRVLVAPRNSAGKTSHYALAARKLAQRARDFIRAYYAAPVSVADICWELGVSIRTLQRCFSDYYGVTPLQFVRSCRLDAARAALLAADPREDTVTRIARDCGVSHLGRFGRYYAAQFGELPSQTLRRAPSAQPSER